MKLRLLLPLLLCVLLAACAAPRGPAPVPPGEPAEPTVPPVVQDANPTDGRCAHCGVVEAIERTTSAAPEKKGEDPALDGIVGGVLDNEKGAPTTSGFSITVRLDNGSVVTIRQRALGGVRQGLRVEIIDGRAQPLLQ